MADKAFFAGEHSTVLINFNHVAYAISEGPYGGELTVFMVDGVQIVLEKGNGDMFRTQWRSFNENKS